MKYIRQISNTAIIFLGLALIIFLYLKGQLLLGMILTIIWSFTGIILFYKKAYPFRFMYPGLLTFFLFMIIPIIFTIYISFTNLGTGHLLSKNDVHDILSTEKYIPTNAKTWNYFLYKKNKEFILRAHCQECNDSQSLTGTFNLSSKKVSLKQIQYKLDLRPLRPGIIFSYLKKLKKISFKLPDMKTIRIVSTTNMTDIRNRYQKLEKQKLRDNITGSIYSPNQFAGFYSNGKENISPGFYTNTGLNNFIKLFTNQKMKGPFLKVILWTFIWGLGSVFFTFSIGIMLAILINDKRLKGKFLYRILLIIPYSIPFFISVLIFRGLFNKDFGIINEIVSFIFNTKIDWLGDPIWAKISCLMVNLWLGFPYMFLVTTGILQSIPNSIYEAASLDGAGRFVTFRKITLPLVMTAITPLLIGSFAFNINNFVGIYLLTGGGPPILEASTPVGETDILISYTYRLAFEGGQGQDFGMASAIALIIFVLIAILTIFNFKLSGMFKEQEIR